VGFIGLIALATALAQSAGEATIWYLGHAGWAVKTQSHLLIFDYWEARAPEDSPSLSNGFVNPAEISDQNVYVFVSHAHGDHYDRSILRWRETVQNITYIFGWEERSDPGFVCMTEPRGTRRLGELEVSVINHAFDNIPEVAYLVSVDGLVIYHSGDHATVADKPNPTFVDNIDHLAGLGKDIDIAFLSIFGRSGGGIINNGDLYTFDKLRPKAMFPMHQGNNEAFYEQFYKEIRNRELETKVYFAKRPGDRFDYRDGLIQQR
jgi:L-ascorbate metabolism protein UlaG (beta-lactamase superfamily)